MCHRLTTAKIFFNGVLAPNTSIRISYLLMPNFRFLSLQPLMRFIQLVIILAVLSAGQTAFGQQKKSERALPRFVSTSAKPINVRVGPGTRYAVAWEFNKSGLPVEVIQEFDVWRKIKYVDGEEGWIHQNLLSGRRSGITRPFAAGGRTAIYSEPLEGASVRAWLEAGFLVSVKECVDGWCEVETPTIDGSKKFKGYVVQFELWGVYPDETID